MTDTIRSTPIAGYKAYSSHVTLMLWRGADIDDPTGRLQRSGPPGMASVKLRGVDDVDEAALRSWLRQALQQHQAGGS